MADWVRLDSSFFDAGEQELEGGWMALDDAKQKALDYGDQALGICVQDGDESSCYCSIVKTGTQKWADSSGAFYCLVYKVCLPPDDGSLFADDFAETDDAGTDYSWQRPGRGDGLGDAKKNICLFESVDPADLHQGSLGDCWLISSFAALAEFPDALKGLFSPQKISEDGQYTVSLYSYEQGGMKQIVVDDRLPVSGSSAAYVQITESGEIWPCLLEKAFASYCGGYAALDGGFPEFALGALAGSSAILCCDYDGETWNVMEINNQYDNTQDYMDNYDVTNSTPTANEDFFQMMADWDSQNFLMCAGSHSGSDSDTNTKGVVQGHAYTILQVLPNVAGSGYNLMQLRNPWGSGEWSGDWSDSSALWGDNPEVADACGWEEADDGLFWISFEDFCENYSQVNCVKKDMGVNRGKKAALNKPSEADAPAFPMKISPGLQNKRKLISKITTACLNGKSPCAIM